jgi:hypothetical protein
LSVPATSLALIRLKRRGWLRRGKANCIVL